MADVLVLGAGLDGLATAMLLAGDGHEVTVLLRPGALAPPSRLRPARAGGRSVGSSPSTKGDEMGASTPDEVIKHFEKHFNAGDLDGLLGLYEPEAVFLPAPGQDAVSGLDAIRENLQGFLATGGTITFSKSVVFPCGDVALCHNSFRLEARDEQGNDASMGGTTAEVVRRQADGTWKYAVDNPYGNAALDEVPAGA